jgi:hypothetical protein
MTVLGISSKAGVATLLLFASLTGSAYSADIVQRSTHSDTQPNMQIARSNYVSEECELLEITYRQPSQTEIVSVCYPPIF